METEFENSDEIKNGMQISSNVQRYLIETGKWSMMLSIIGFVFVGLMVILAFSIGSIFSQLDNENMPFSGSTFTYLYLGLAVIYFFPILYLFNFSKNIKQALIHTDSFALDRAFENLKSHYKFLGIMTAIVLGLYTIVLGGAFFFGGLMSM